MNMDPICESEVTFYKTLQNKLKLVYLYENLSLLKHAVDLVPTEDLNMKAMLKLSVLENTDHAIAFEDLLLMELLNWFKFSFFTWVDAPKCQSCGQITKHNGLTRPNDSEMQWIVSTVEQYFCEKCQLSVRFPRFNHPKKLLETRCGRCGEWANCFTLLCRALGYDARLVFDWNDHVWTEVFSFAQNRWLHCDSCENICDKPLLYEIGWKKPISYVIAFSKDEIQDVTWRYTSNFSEVMNRRKLCREEWLLNTILSLTEKLQTNVSSERRRELAKRRVLELAEFLSPPKVEDENYGGRTSGSLAWRIGRGETELEMSNNYEFTLTDKEMAESYFHVKYSCALDKYIRVSDGFTESERWSTCVFDHSDIFRKVEADWKVTYLARIEESKSSKISWKFNFDDSGFVIQTLEVCLKSKTFESGKVKWLISAVEYPNICYTYEENDISLKMNNFKGCTGLIISAELSGGNGRIAWQHTQLFRQPVDSTEFPFEVKIYLEKKY